MKITKDGEEYRANGEGISSAAMDAIFSEVLPAAEWAKIRTKLETTGKAELNIAHNVDVANSSEAAAAANAIITTADALGELIDELSQTLVSLNNPALQAALVEIVNRKER